MNDKEFNQFYKACYPYCFSRLFFFTKSRKDAEDYFQEAMIKYWTKQGKLKHQANLKAFILVIARNKWLSDQKKKGGIIPTEAEDLFWQKQQYETKVNLNGVAQFDHLVRKEEEELEKIKKQTNRDKLRQGLSKLGERCRQLLIERIAYETSVKEIEVQFSFNSNQAARNTISRCKKKLIELSHQK